MRVCTYYGRVRLEFAEKRREKRAPKIAIILVHDNAQLCIYTHTHIYIIFFVIVVICIIYRDLVGKDNLKKNS